MVVNRSRVYPPAPSPRDNFKPEVDNDHRVMRAGAGTGEGKDHC